MDCPTTAFDDITQVVVEAEDNKDPKIMIIPIWSEIYNNSRRAKIWPLFKFGIIAGEGFIMTDVSDEWGIEKVEFYIDNDLIYTDEISPYTYTWDENGPSGLLNKVKAVVYDFAGNTATDQLFIMKII